MAGTRYPAHSPSPIYGASQFSSEPALITEPTSSSSLPPNTEMKFKKTRIAVSVHCSILCLLLIALWVRSYWSSFLIVAPLPHDFGSSVYESSQGSLTCCVTYGQYMLNGDDESYWGVHWKTLAYVESNLPSSKRPFFLIRRQRNWYGIVLPYWFLVLVSGSVTVGAIFCHVPRFRLRTLFIATTVVAVLLWFIVWMTRS